MPHSPRIIRELEEILDRPLNVSQEAFVFAEIVTGDMVYVGMAEFRDAVFHISRALQTDSEDEALSNLDAAFEHIRRAGVESVEWAAARRYKEVKRIIQTPFFLSKLILGKRKEKILLIERQVRKLLIDGRKKKSEKGRWVEAIRDYKLAIEKTDKLYELCPTKFDYWTRVFFLIAALATLFTFAVDLFLLLR